MYMPSIFCHEISTSSLKSWMYKVIGFIMIPSLSYAQKPLEMYVQKGLENNLVLQQKNVQLDQAKISLKQAKSLFYPSLDFNVDYTFGTGGRRIDIPIGDLLNDVYSTLNQLTQSSSFPQVENVNEELNPYDFYDARVGARMPIYNREIIRNKRITQRQVNLSEQEVVVYKRDLVRAIKVAYYNFIKAENEVAVYESSIVLLERNKQVNESLIANGRGLKTDLLRVISQLESVNANLELAKNNVKNAGYYLNFLINEPLETPIISTEPGDLIDPERTTNIDGREELVILDEALQINDEIIGLRKDYIVPELGLFVDAGSQAFDFEVNDDSWYVFGGVNMRIPLFQGNNNRYKIQQAKLDKSIQQTELENTKRQLSMAANIALNDMETAFKNHEAAIKRVKASESYFTLVETGFKEGTNSQIELIDAQNQLNSANLQLNISLFDIYAKQAALERQTASYQFQ